jgi:hypothetical protein
MFEDKSTAELLKMSAGILRELQRRRIIDSANNPVADIAERIVIDALGLVGARKSAKGYDATDMLSGDRYEIKARRLTPRNPSRQLSFIRGLGQGNFTYLAGVLFTEDYQILRACVIPRTVVEKFAKFVPHVNGWRLILRESIWEEPGVLDITERLTAALEKL